MKQDDFNGAWHEMWDAVAGMSRSHAWCAGPTALLPELVLGLEPLKPGWKAFKIQLRLCDLDWAESKGSTMQGDIRVKASRLWVGGKDKGILIEANVPEGSTKS